MSWITRRFNGCTWIWFPLALVLLSSSVTAVDDLLAIQGNVYSGGSTLGFGNVSFKLSVDACGTFFYDSGNDFNNSVVAGQFDNMLGNTSLTSLVVDPTERYLYLQEFVNGAIQTWNSTGGDCLQFSNPFYMNNETIYQNASSYNETILIDSVNLTWFNQNTTNYAIFLTNASYNQWRNATYYADEWWINRETINASNYNFTFNQTNHDTVYYNKTEVDNLVSSIAFELYLHNTSDTDLPAYNIMNETNSLSANERSIQITVAADATLLKGFVANASINILRSGIYDAHIHANATTVGKQDARIYWEGYVRYANGTEVLLVASEESGVLTSSSTNYEIHGSLLEDFEVNASSDKFVAKFYANLEGAGGNPDVWMLIEGHTSSRFVLQTTSDAFSNLYLQLSGANADQNIDVQPYNFTANYCNGLYNWTTNQSFLTFNGSTLYWDFDTWNASYYVQWSNLTLTDINTSLYTQWTNNTYYSDEWFINREMINGSNYNFTFNESKIEAVVNVTINITGSDIFLRRDTTNDPIYNTLNDQGAIWLRSNMGNLTHNATPQKPASAYPGVNVSGAPDVGGNNKRKTYLLFNAHDYRIRQDGLINGFDFQFNTSVGLDEFRITVWRLSDSTGNYTRIATSEDLYPSMTNGTNNLTLVTPLTVREGDFLGAQILCTVCLITPELQLKGNNVTLGATHYSYTQPSATYNWSNTVDPVLYYANLVVPVVAKMDAPQAVFIGDSIMDGFNSNTSLRNHAFIDNRNYTAINYTPSYKVRTALGWTGQDMAFGGQLFTSEITPRVDQDVIDMQPQVAFIGGGTNDIIFGDGNLDWFIYNYTEVLNKTKNASIFTVVMSIPPANCTVIANFTKCYMITEWNAALENLVDTYENAIFADVLDYVGCLNSTGDGYEPCAEYYDDGLHFAPDGNSKLAESLLHHAGGQRATSQFAEQFVATAGMTFNEQGLPISSAFGVKTTWFGRGGGGTSIFADQAEYNQYAQLIAHTDAVDGNGKASAVVLGDGKILMVSAEGTTDGEEATPVFTGQYSANRSWTPRQLSSSNVFDETDDEYRDVFYINDPIASTPLFAQDTTAFGTSHFDDMTAIDDYYYNHEGEDYLIQIDNGQLPILNITNDGFGAALFYTTSTASIAGLDTITIYGTGTNDGVVGAPIAIFTDAFIDAFAIGNYVANSTGVWEDTIAGANSYKWSTDNGTAWNATKVAMNGTPQGLLWGTEIDFTTTTNHSTGDQWRFSIETDASIRQYNEDDEIVFDVDRYGIIRTEAYDNSFLWAGKNDTSEGMGLAHGDDGSGNGLSMIFDNVQWQGNINLFIPRGTEPSGMAFTDGNISFYSDTGETPGTPYTPTERVTIGDKPNLWIQETDFTAIKIGSSLTSTSTNIGRVDNIGSFFLDDAEYTGTQYIARDTAAGGIGIGGGLTTLYAQTGLTAGNSFTPQNRITVNNSQVTINEPNNAYNFSVHSTGQDNLLFADANEDCVAIGDSEGDCGTAGYTLYVEGSVRTSSTVNIEDAVFLSERLGYAAVATSASTQDMILGYTSGGTPRSKWVIDMGTGALIPYANKTNDLGNTSSYIRYAYLDDAFISGVQTMNDRTEILKELIEHPVLDKQPGDFDYEKTMWDNSTKVEFDPRGLPEGLYIEDYLVRYYAMSLPAVSVYNYKVNYEQQLVLDNMTKSIMELEEENIMLKQRLTALEELMDK